MSDAMDTPLYIRLRVCVLLSAHRNVYYYSCRSCYNYRLRPSSACRNGKQVNTPPQGYSVRGETSQRFPEMFTCVGRQTWFHTAGCHSNNGTNTSPLYTQWLIHALNHIITQFGSTINVLINLKGPKVYVILVILIGASLSPRSRKTCPKFSHVTSLLTSITDLIYRQCIATNNTNRRLNL